MTVSTTEHDLPTVDSDDALDEVLHDEEFDEAMSDAMAEADRGLATDRGLDTDGDDDPVADDESTVPDELDARTDGESDEISGRDGLDADRELDDGDDVDGADEDDAVLEHDDGVDGDVDAVHVDDLDVQESDPATDATAATDVTDAGEIDDEHDAEPAVVDPDVTADHDLRQTEVDDSAAYELPEIVPATPDVVDDADDDDAADDDVTARRSRPLRAPDDDVEDDEVSEEILEELRRADIDGPVVDLAPQDDTANARRKPKRSADYDPAPIPIPAKIPRVLGRKPRVRKVTRVVRHVDPWSVFKIALVAHAVVYVIVLTAGVLLWNVAHATGTVDNVERFFESFGWESFEFDGGEIYHSAWIAGLFAVIGLTGLAVLTASLFNLITDLVGGMRFTVLEEEVVETRVSPMRRFVVRRAEPEVPAVIRDESGAMIREAVVDDTGANPRPSR